MIIWRVDSGKMDRYENVEDELEILVIDIKLLRIINNFQGLEKNKIFFEMNVEEGQWFYELGWDIEEYIQRSNSFYLERGREEVQCGFIVLIK